MSKAAELAALIGSQTAQGNRNLIINGAMQVAQRGTSASVSNSVAYLTLDRWQYSYGHNSSNAYSTWTMSQDSDAPAGFSNSTKFICTTAASAPSTLTATLFQQKFEGQNLQQIQFAKTDAKTLTASFYIKSNKTGNIGVQLFAEDDSTLNSQLVLINSANTWEFKTVTFSSKTSGTEIPNDNTSGLRIRFVFEYNTGRAFGTADTWAAKQTNSQLVPAGTSARVSTANDTFFITGVQLEIGDVATAFEHEDFGTTLAKCQRYLYRHCEGNNVTISNANAYASNMVFGTIHFPTSMRTNSYSLSYPVGTNYYRFYRASANTDFNDWTAFNDRTENACTIYKSSLSGFTAGHAGWLVTSNASAYIEFDAEL